MKGELIAAIPIMAKEDHARETAMAAHAKWLKSGADGDRKAYAVELLRLGQLTRNGKMVKYAENLLAGRA
ncbi:MAG: hypothetical protein WC683_18305 [bacterium]